MQEWSTKKNLTQPVEHVRNNNIDVKVDVVSSSIDNDSKDDNINNIIKDKYSTLHVDIWDNNMKATTATIDNKSVDKYFKATKENEKNKTKENKTLNDPYISYNTDLSDFIINLNIATKAYDK